MIIDAIGHAPGDKSQLPRGLASELLLRRLRAVCAPNPAELELLRSLGGGAKHHLPGTLICPKSDGSPHPRLIVSGWACRPRMLPDGRRQMLGVLMPGDVIGDRGGGHPLATSPAAALTRVRTISVARLVEASTHQSHTYPNLGPALQTLERSEESRLLDLVVRLGCQTALQRLASCLLEFYQRSEIIHFTHGSTFPMPLTQEKLGDLLGLSLVHLNRVISQLRREKLVEIRAGLVTIHDFARVASIADRPDPTAPERR